MGPRAWTGTSTSARGTCWLGPLLVLLTACEARLGPSFSNVCLASEVSLCDVRERSCQVQVGAYVACLAERDFDSVPMVVSSTLTRARDPYGPRLHGVRPALFALGLSGSSTTPPPLRWDWANGVIERAELPAYDDAAAVLGLSFAMALALYDQTQGWAALEARRLGFDETLALRSLWTGVAVLWADHVNAALNGLGYVDLPRRGGELVEPMPLPWLARRYEGVYGGPWVSKRWLAEDLTAAVEAPPEVASVFVGDRPIVTSPISDGLILPSTLVVAGSQPLGGAGALAWRLARGLSRGSPERAGDRLFYVEDTTTRTSAALWLHRDPNLDTEALRGDVEVKVVAAGTLIAAHPDPQVRAALFTAGEVLLRR